MSTNTLSFHFGLFFFFYIKKTLNFKYYYSTNILNDDIIKLIKDIYKGNNEKNIKKFTFIINYYFN